MQAVKTRHRIIPGVICLLGMILPQVSAQESVSFETAKARTFDTLETAIGTWTPEAGKTIVDTGHAKSGKQCLQLTGGTQTSVVLRIADQVDTPGNLTFWAERWTSRSPFSFRIDKRTSQGWEEVFNGDNAIRVGRAFLSHVTVRLSDPGIRHLRFTVTSPPNTGLLIDDIRIARDQPQRIRSVEVIPFSLPALSGSEASPLVKLKVETTGALNPISLTAVKVTLDGTTTRSDITSIGIHATGANGQFRAGESVSQIDGRRLRRGPFELSCEGNTCQLAEGVNYFWVIGKLKTGADIDHRVGAVCKQVLFSDGKKVKLEAEASSQRMGVAVRQGGDQGVHTYRIPGLATTNRGTLIGVYDIRHRSGGDLPGDIDVGMSRSTDGGQAWEPMRVIMDMGDDPDFRYDGIGDPAVLVDRNTGTIWVAATWSHGNRSWRGSGPGMTPEDTGQLMLVRSDDDGVTWSRPINITEQVKDPAWCFILQGPGKGITMRDGTLVFAAQYQDPPTKRRLPHSTIIYSKDHGTTWQVGTGAFDDTTESQVVEIEPGVLMLNCRYNRKPARVVMTTRDMGKTWHKHTASERALIEPGSCMASLIDVDREAGTDLGGWLLFSNPDSTQGRHHITIKGSPDRGLTWPKAHRLLLDEGKGAGYSCLSMIDEKTVGILYEGSQAHMTFQRIPLKDLVKPDERSTTDTAVETRLQLPRVFGDHMVLQADAEIPMWGHAKPGAKVTVTLENETQSSVANGQGEWRLRLSPRKANAAPAILRIQSTEEHIEFRDVVIGEVWICAGQSNMEWPLKKSTNGKKELAAAHWPQLRLLHLTGRARGSSGSYTPVHLARLTPDTFGEGAWRRASAESTQDFSAVAWYFGRCLAAELEVPVGLICPAVGGSPTEAWIPREALEADPALKGLVAGNWLNNERLGEFCRTRGEQNLLRAIQAGDTIPGDEFGPNHSFKPGFMWSAGIEPLIPYAIRGAIWYQGESNAETPVRVREHGRLFPLLIEQWRTRWGQGDFPFLYVQLPAMNRPEWPWFRDGQRRVLNRVENVGMAVTLDTGLAANVHPPLKKPVGERLAALALGKTYGVTSPASSSGPLLSGAERIGGAMVVSFKHVGDGLKSSGSEKLPHFEIRGKDQVFYPATARIIGHDRVAVSSPAVLKPTQVRYAWRPFPDPPVNLVNSVGLPASPFSTESEDAVFAQREAEARRPNILFIVSEDNSEHLGCYGEQRVHTPHLDALATGGIRYTRAYVPYSVCSPSRAAFLTGLYPRQTGQIGLATHRFSMYRDFKTIPAYFQQAGYYTGFLGKTHVNPESLVEDHIDHRAIKGSNFAKTISIEEYAKEAGVVMDNAAASQKPFMLIINYPDAHRSFVGKSKNGFPTTMVEQDIAPFPWIGSDTPHLRQELRNYFNCMNRLDEGIGMVLDKLHDTGLRDNTLIVYISDHGADFPRAKGSIYENGTRIPMIVNYPKTFRRSVLENPVVRPRASVFSTGKDGEAGDVGVYRRYSRTQSSRKTSRSKPDRILRQAPRGKVEHGMVSTLDVLPTMLRAARLPVPDVLPGFALQDIDSGKASPREYIHTFTTGSSPNLLYLQFGIRDDRYKLVYNPDRAINLLAVSRYRNSRLPKDQEVASFIHPPEYELFDLEKDPYEWKNLADSAEHKNTKARLLKAMQAFQHQIKDPFASQENIAAFIAEQREYHGKPYRRAGFRWPHLDMFEQAQETSEAKPLSEIIFQQRDIPSGVPRKGHAKDATQYGYRIPSLLVTKKGSILAFAERRLGLHDHAQNDIVLRRSTDGGRTWSEEIVAHEDGMNSINDPLTVQLENGRILLMFARFPYGRHARDAGWIRMADLGYDDPQANVLTFICHSDDDGKTWSRPVDISRQVKHPQLLNANTPGAMIQLTQGPHRGRVVTGLWGTLPIIKDGKRSRQWRVVVAYSDDYGKTWERTDLLNDASGKGFPNECQVVEAANGDLVLITRNQAGDRFRKKAVSRDSGETWSPLDIDRGLPSVACMGSVVRGPVKEDGTWDLWAAFPSDAGRKDGQIVVSEDHGKTWRIAKVIHGPFAYSALQVSPDGEALLCLYESDGYRTLTLTRLAFAEGIAP